MARFPESTTPRQYDPHLAQRGRALARSHPPLAAPVSLSTTVPAQRVTTSAPSLSDENDPNIEADARYVEQLLRQPDTSRMELGRYLAERYYAGSEKEFRERRTKDYSLEKLVSLLEARGVAKASKSTLRSCIAVHFQEQALQLTEEGAASLSFSHRVAILGVSSDEGKAEAAQRAIVDNLSVAELRRHLAIGAKKATASPARKINMQAEKLFDLVTGGFDRSPADVGDLTSALGMIKTVADELESVLAELHGAASENGVQTVAHGAEPDVVDSGPAAERGAK